MRTTADPYMNFRFLVEFDGVQRGGFNKVKGVAREIKVDSYHEGGQNEFEHKLASQTTYGNVTLEHGLVDDYLWGWQQDAAEGRIERRTVTVILRDGSAKEVWRWLIDRAFPVKWNASDLDAGAAQVLVESVELAHHGIRKG
ncbi:phage tail protein [Bradyrhizobium symbiodeficiens]|uniref:Phage tail protein n=1 Tax=Bradyrhizobium symbiodeficiens TaxID=1404367 RepID=A0ABX5W4Z5_9BRAD|nr:phage tail protein [Bradyrhizobium symbiodeficiens]QDF37513.1 phage tail protein [Bradyrhizobium symbiodeficiens]